MTNKKDHMKYLLIIGLFFTFSCSSDDLDIPLCIDEILEEFKKDACRESGDLTLWNFNGQEVYCFQKGNCIADGTADIYDENCNLLCSLGGFAGVTECQGLDWETNAFFIDTIYAH